MPSQATPAPPHSDLSLRASVSGLDARVVLHSASETGPFVLSLGSDQHMQLVADGSGAIQVTEAYSSYDATGVATGTYTRTEYTVQPPLLLDSSPAVTTPVSTGPATATLSGPLTVTLSVDPGWLNSPGRIFPATLDLPIVTAAASAHTGLLGTVNSCAPNTPAPRSEVVVGAQGGCTYHGQVYFDLTSLLLDTPIQTATLRLYTPAQTTATGVQVYSNTAGSGFDPTVLPTWNSAPTTGGSAIAQSGSDGHWQSWDVSSLVQQWVADASTNGVLTLQNSGAPVVFASPLGAGRSRCSGHKPEAGPARMPALPPVYNRLAPTPLHR